MLFGPEGRFFHQTTNPLHTYTRRFRLLNNLIQWSMGGLANEARPIHLSLCRVRACIPLVGLIQSRDISRRIRQRVCDQFQEMHAVVTGDTILLDTPYYFVPFREPSPGAVYRILNRKDEDSVNPEIVDALSDDNYRKVKFQWQVPHPRRSIPPLRAVRPFSSLLLSVSVPVAASYSISCKRLHCLYSLSLSIYISTYPLIPANIGGLRSFPCSLFVYVYVCVCCV